MVLAVRVTSASARGERIRVPEPRSSKDSAGVPQCRASYKALSRTAGLPEELEFGCARWVRAVSTFLPGFGVPDMLAGPSGPRPGHHFDVWLLPAASSPPQTPASQ